MKENEFAPLELYIAFESLPTRQVSLIMATLSNLYALLRDPDMPVRYFEPRRYPFTNYWLDEDDFVNALDSELCLDFARTGNSITFKFTGHGRYPTITSASGNIEVEMPIAWGAAAVAVGALVLGAEYSQEVYKRHLDNQLKIAQTRTENLRGDTEKLRGDLVAAEIENMKAKTESIHQARKAGRGTARSPRERRTEHAIINNIEVFQTIIQNENITAAAVNGFPLKEKQDDLDKKTGGPES